MNPTKPDFRLSAFALALLATACGGGGHGHDDDDDFTGATAGGSAGKGIIVGGAVEAFEITAGTVVSRGSATTTATGQYSLSLGDYTGGPLMIQITGGGGAVMKCDVQAGCGDGIAFGQTLPLASGFVMRTVMPTVPSGGQLARCISPFTELAVQRAIDGAGGNLNNVSAANAAAGLSEVSQLVGGIDVLRTCVVDLTDPAVVDDASDAALALSGLSAAVLSVGGSADPSTALTALKTAFAGGSIAASSLNSLLASASSELAAVSPGSESNTAYMLIGDAIEAAGPDGTVNPEPSPGSTSNLAEVEKGKALIGSVRSLALNLTADARDGETKPVVSAFVDQLETAADAVESTQVANALGVALDEIAAFYEGVPDGSGTASGTITTVDSGGVTRTASITVTKPASGNHTIAVTGRIRDFTANLSASGPVDPAVVDGTPRNFAANIDATFESASGVGVRAKVHGAATVSALTYNAALDRYDGAGAAFDGTANFSQIGVADPFAFAGTVSVKAVDCTQCAASVTRPDGVVDDGEALNLDLFTLKGTFSNSKAAFEATVSVDMDTASAAKYDIRLPVSSNNVPSGKVSVQVDAALDGFHTYRVALVAELDDVNSLVLDNENGVDLYNLDATLTASLRRDNSTLTITAVARPPTATSNVVNLVIADQDGATIRVDNLSGSGSAPAAGVIIVDDKQVGTIQETDRGIVIIRWTDGTIESLG